MGLLIFFGVLAGIAIVFVVAYRLMVGRRGPTVPMVRIGIASGSGEARLWANSLRSAGIRCRVQDIYSGIGAGFQYPNAYGPELWVREKDEKEAREVLGL